MCMFMCVNLQYFLYTGPIGQEFTIENVAPGEYSLRAIARAGTERYVASATLTVPDSGSCAVHLINRGVTVIGDTVTIEFAGAGPITSFSCALDDQRPQPCKRNSLVV